MAYVAWVRRYGVFGESGIEYFSRTTDAGRSWSSPRPIYIPLTGQFTDPTLIEVLPDGTLLNIFLLANGTFALPEPSPVVPWDLMVTRSTDGGDTWSGAQKIATVQPYPPSDPDNEAEVRAIPVISTALGPNGRAYVAWNEKPSRDTFDKGFVRIARSGDNGASWSEPRVVAEVEAQTFLPTVAVAGDGTVGVLWDDTRRDRDGDDEFTADVWFSHSHDGGRSWDARHVAGPFDLLAGPRSGSAGIGGIFLGDYQDLAGLPRGFGGVFAASPPLAKGGPSDVFFVRLKLDGPRRGSPDGADLPVEPPDTPELPLPELPGPELPVLP